MHKYDGYIGAKGKLIAEPLTAPLVPKTKKKRGYRGVGKLFFGEDILSCVRVLQKKKRIGIFRERLLLCKKYRGQKFYNDISAFNTAPKNIVNIVIMYDKHIALGEPVALVADIGVNLA